MEAGLELEGPDAQPRTTLPPRDFNPTERVSEVSSGRAVRVRGNQGTQMASRSSANFLFGIS